MFRNRGLSFVEVLVVVALVVGMALLALAPSPEKHAGDSTRVQTIRSLGNATLKDGAGLAADVAANPPGTDPFYAADPTVSATWPRKLQVVVATGTASTFLWKRGASGSYVYLNGGQALAADAEYAFTMRVEPGEVVNFKLGTSGTLKVFRLIASEE